MGYGLKTQVWNRIFPVVITLAVDSEGTTRTLFSKLLVQLIHWFAHDKAKDEETASLLSALSEGIADEGGGVRDLCAASLAEFMRYAIKQATKKQMAAQVFGADKLLSRLKAMLVHPDRTKRMGAVAAWGKIFRDFREQTALGN